MPIGNNNFDWRPNDQSGLTNIRYSIEAQKWYDNLSDIHRSQMSGLGSLASSFNFVSMVISLFFCVLLVICLTVLSIFVKSTDKYNDVPVSRKDYSDKLLRMPIREDYPDENEYYDVLGAFLMSKKDN